MFFFVRASVLGFLISLFGLVGLSFAHPLLEENVVEFVVQNPDLTQEEFEEFLWNEYVENQENIPTKDDYVAFGDVSDEELDSIITEMEQGFALFDPDDPWYPELEQVRKSIDLYNSLTEEKTFWQNAKDFFVLGVDHILQGWDHILFVLSLILVVSSWRRILALVTTFTVAHSVTLLLAGTGVFTVSGGFVEPLIAFSIAYMALTTVFLRRYEFFGTQHNKLWVIFFFGLFHGLGFAGFFSDLRIPEDKYVWSLLFFNGGVEVGQILILLLVVPVLLWLSKKYPKVHDILIKIFAVVISFLALYWMFDRI